MRSLVIILAAALCLPPLAPAATLAVPAQGTAVFTVPASQYLDVFVKGASAAIVQKQVGYPNMPSSFVTETNGSVASSEVIFGPYTLATVIRISAGNGQALYSIGSGGLAVPCSEMAAALAPSAGSVQRITSRITMPATVVAKTGTGTLTAADLLGGLVTSTTNASANQTYTVPTGVLLDAALPFLQAGEGFEWTLINLSTTTTDTATIAAGTGHTLVGVAVVQTTNASTGGLYGSSGKFLTVKTGAATYVTYRLN